MYCKCNLIILVIRILLRHDKKILYILYLTLKGHLKTHNTTDYTNYSLHIVDDKNVPRTLTLRKTNV